MELTGFFCFQFSLFSMESFKSVQPSAEQQAHALAVRSPILALLAEQCDDLRGQIVALLLDGPEKGKVIATAPIDYDHPQTPRQSIKEQVAASPYKGNRYQLRSILGGTD